MTQSATWPRSGAGELSPDTQALYCFDDFELDGAIGELRYRGEPVEIRAKPLALLRYLAANHARVVSADELLRSVWPDVVVSPWALSSALRDLRRALSKGARTRPAVRTQRGRGYRLQAEVTSRSTLHPAEIPTLEEVCCASKDHLLLVASLLGASFDAEQLAGLVGRSQSEVTMRLDRVVAARWVQRRVEAGVRYAFGAGAIRDSLYAMHSDVERVCAHRLIASRLESARWRGASVAAATGQRGRILPGAEGGPC